MTALRKINNLQNKQKDINTNSKILFLLSFSFNNFIRSANAQSASIQNNNNNSKNIFALLNLENQ